MRVGTRVARVAMLVLPSLAIVWVAVRVSTLSTGKNRGTRVDPPTGLWRRQGSPIFSPHHSCMGRASVNFGILPNAVVGIGGWHLTESPVMAMVPSSPMHHSGWARRR
eukprot:COSAG01_NODE_5755_length_4054_cov_11.104930_4_plen_108_part_00